MPAAVANGAGDVTDHLPPRPPEHVAHADRPGDGHHPDGDHRRGGALVPRARRPAADAVVGGDARRTRSPISRRRRVSLSIPGSRSSSPRSRSTCSATACATSSIRERRADGGSAARGDGPLGPVRHGRRPRACGRPALVHARRGRGARDRRRVGCGKSVTCMSLVRLLPETAVVTGSAVFDGVDLLALSPRELRRVRGREIAFVFQEPMTSLNPVFTVGRQIGEVLTRAPRAAAAARAGAGDRAARARAHPGAGAAPGRVSAPALRRDAPARDDRDRARLRSEGARSRTSRRPRSTSRSRPGSST